MLKECSKGNHSFLEITNKKLGYGEIMVVRWCKLCGAIVIDREVDGRLFPGYYKKCKIPKAIPKLWEEINK